MHGTVEADEVKDPFDQGISARVVELAERDAVAEVSVAIGVTSGATQRALASDFNGE
jgi:hypothetical protein